MPALAGIGGRLALGYLGSCQPCLPIPAVAGIGVFYKFHRGTRVPRQKLVNFLTICQGFGSGSGSGNR